MLLLYIILSDGGVSASITAKGNPESVKSDLIEQEYELKALPLEGLLLAAGVLADRISFSPMPTPACRFDSEGRLIELRCGQIASLCRGASRLRPRRVSPEVALGVVG